MSRRPHVLYVTYNGLLEPLGLRQGLAYVERLADEFRFTVLSFEKATGAAWRDGRRAIEARLAERAIGWLPLRYHKRPSLPATAYDVLNGARVGRRLLGADPFELVHARGYVAAAVAWLLARGARVPYLFDIRGLMAEENAESGLWQPESLRYRLTKRAEHALLRDAAALVTLTTAVQPYLRSQPALSGRADLPWAVIPCCVDTDEFTPSAASRERIRAELGIDRRPALVYAGSIGTWYMLQEMVELYREARAAIPGLVFLLVVNNEPARAEAAIRAAGLGPEDARIIEAAAAQVPGYLAAADIGIAFYRPGLSRTACSPTKVAEYLACGLPVVLNAGIGDSDRLAEAGVAAVASELTRPAIQTVARRLPELLAIPRERVRAVATAEFSLATIGRPRYAELYRRVIGRGGSGPPPRPR